jgi:hypothetical protein
VKLLVDLAIILALLVIVIAVAARIAGLAA